MTLDNAIKIIIKKKNDEKWYANDEIYLSNINEIIDLFIYDFMN